MSNIHDELHRLVLRKRWIKWSLRNWKPGDYAIPNGRHVQLSDRLTKWKPTFEQRRVETEFEEEEVG